MGNQKKKETSFFAMVKKHQKVILKVISAIIAGIFLIVATQMKSCNDTNIANKNNQVEQNKIQLEKETSCKADAAKKYDVDAELDKLERYFTTIGVLTQKDSDFKKGIGEALTEEERSEIRAIYNDLTFIRVEVPMGEPLKSMMEYYARQLLPELLVPNPAPRTSSTTMDNLVKDYKKNLREYIEKQIEADVEKCLNKGEDSK